MALLPSYLTLLVLLPSLGSTSLPPKMLLLWENADFAGASSYVLVTNHNCIQLLKQWQNRVSSIETNKLCYQLYEGKDCDGKEVYVYPMSKHHNDLAALGMNDKTNSVRLCNLDEESLDSTLVPLDKNKPEYAFWDFFFGKVSGSYRKAFQHLAAKHNYTFIPWNFIPGIRRTAPLSQQYQSALDWLLAYIRDREFQLTTLKELRKLGYKVFDDRANANAIRMPNPSLGTRKHAIFFQLEVYWKLVVEVIDDNINLILERLGI